MELTEISTHDVISFECHAAGFEPDDLCAVVKPLLKMFNKGKAYRIKMERLGIAIGESGDSTKIPYRTRFIRVMEKPQILKKSEKEKYAWEVACTSWFDGKAKMLLEHMKEVVEDGDMMALIIESVYLKGDNIKKSNKAMEIKLGYCRTSYYKFKRDAIALFGLLLWKYCVKRDQEDKAAGIIDDNGNMIKKQ